MKPLVAVERYELTQAIASCATKIGFLDSDCVKKDPDATPQMKDLAWTGWFHDGGCASDKVATGTDPYDGMCYHTNANAAFNS